MTAAARGGEDRGGGVALGKGNTIVPLEVGGGYRGFRNSSPFLIGTFCV